MNSELFYQFAYKIYDLLDVIYFNKKETSPRDVVSKLIKPNDMVLDMCTGTATLSAKLAVEHPHSKIIGIDLSKEMLHIANQKIEEQGITNLKLLHMNASSMQFKSKTFDKVILSLVLHELEEPVAANILSEARRVLKDNGQLIIVEWKPNTSIKEKLLFSPIYVLEPAPFRSFMHKNMPVYFNQFGLDYKKEKLCDYTKVMVLKKQKFHINDLSKLSKSNKSTGDFIIEDNKKFWNNVSLIYTGFMKKNNDSYIENCKMIRPYLKKNMTVLELACGTGQMSFPLSSKVKKWEATDFSPSMIEECKRINKQQNRNKKYHNIDFSVADATKLNYPDQSFDMVIIANALHIMPEPELAMKEIQRVLKPNGILFAPTFIYDKQKNILKIKLMEKLGFRTYHKWSPVRYKKFIQSHHFDILEKAIIQGEPLNECSIIARKK